MSDHETALLGCLLRTPGRIHDAETLTRADFIDPKNWATLEAMRAVAASGSQICAERIEIELQRGGKAFQTLGPDFFEGLAARAVGDMGEHIERVLQASLRRKALAALDRARVELEGDEPGAVDRAVSSLLKAAAPRDGRAIASEGEALERDILAAMANNVSSGLSTGFAGLDRLDVKLVPSEVVVLAASTSVGKSALAGQIALNVSRDGARVLFCSLEMSKPQVLRRFVSQVARLPLEFAAEASPARIADAARRVSQTGLCVADLCGDSRLETLVQVAQGTKARGGLDVLIVDYLGLLRLSGPRLGAYEATSVLSREIKQLAGRLECAVLLLAQLNRGPSAREDSKPRLSDLRDSGAIEQDADKVVFIHRGRGSIDGELVIAKNRSGPCGDIPIHFDGATCFFSEPEGSERPAPKPAPRQTEIEPEPEGRPARREVRL